MKHFKTILLWVASLWFHDIDQNLTREYITRWLILIGKYIRTKGLVWTIKRIKLLRLIVTRYLSGAPIFVSDQLVGITKDGFPKAILFLKGMIDSNRPSEVRFVLTLLTLSRAMKCEAKPDYSSITKEFTGDFQEIDKGFVETFVRDFGLVLLRPTWSRDLHFFTNKAGPLGQPLITALHAIKAYDGPMWTAVAMIVGIPGAEAIKDLWMRYRDVLNWDEVSKKADNLNLKPNSNGQLPLRRLSIVQDPELKARVVGIVDYFSQVVLQPLSEQLFNLLRSMPQDRTFTQDPHIGRVEGHKYHSIDLSSATDRFPLTLQKQLLAEMLGESFAWAWGVLMSYNEFVSPCGQRLRYAVGQPMGARSSWAMFTLTHHMAVQYAAFRVGEYPFKDYILLGDDIVITNDKVAESYKQLIIGLGVEISSMKTHVSETTYEFAKRWFHNGVEVTGFPINAVASTVKAPLELYSAVREWVIRGNVPFHFEDSVEAVCMLYDRLGWKGSKIRSINRILITFRFTLRNLNSFNYDEVRAFFANATKDHEEYVIPASSTMLEVELTRVASAVASGMVMGLTHKLSRYQNKLDRVVVESIGPNLPSKFDSSDHPLRDAIKNSISSLVELGNSLSVWGDLLPLLEITTIVDLDQLDKRRRRSVALLYRMSTFGKAMYSQLMFEPTFEANINHNFRVQHSVRDLNRKMKVASLTKSDMQSLIDLAV